MSSWIRAGSPTSRRGPRRAATFRPTPVQRPRPPVWIGGNWPSPPALRRAARWDGVAPMVLSPDDGSWKPTAAVVTEILAAVGEHRNSTEPFDVVMTGRTRPDQPAAARETVEAIAAAGATWWLEGFRPQPGEYDAALRRIEAGPPR